MDCQKKYFHPYDPAGTLRLAFSCLHPPVLTHMSLSICVYAPVSMLPFLFFCPHKKMSSVYPLEILQPWTILWISRETGLRTLNWHHVNTCLRTKIIFLQNDHKIFWSLSQSWISADNFTRLRNHVNFKGNRIENSNLTPREYLFVNTIKFLTKWPSKN